MGLEGGPRQQGQLRRQRWRPECAELTADHRPRSSLQIDPFTLGRYYRALLALLQLTPPPAAPADLLPRCGAVPCSPPSTPRCCLGTSARLGPAAAPPWPMACRSCDPRPRTASSRSRPRALSRRRRPARPRRRCSGSQGCGLAAHLAGPAAADDAADDALPSGRYCAGRCDVVHSLDSGGERRGLCLSGLHCCGGSAARCEWVPQVQRNLEGIGCHPPPLPALERCAIRRRRALRCSRPGVLPSRALH